MSGPAPDGGLYVPGSWPRIDAALLGGKSYAETAEAVMFPFVSGWLGREEFQKILNATYNEENFQHPEIAPLAPCGDFHVLELFHGPTLAFKDFALQLLGRLFDAALKKSGARVTILGATSGDTGSAAIEGCRHCPGAEIFILFPKGRVSEIQRRQMTTTLAANVHPIAIEGNFDDCQAIVKTLFADADLRQARNLTAVNSINWARIAAQIVYYFYAAQKLRARGRPTFVVPTGNFGNVYAGFAARKMGLACDLVIATNRNDSVTRYFESGAMTRGQVVPTISPSMDIQIASNFERYLFDLLGCDAGKLREAMKDFADTGALRIPPRAGDFRAFRVSEEETLATIRRVHEAQGTILDPHSAVGAAAAQNLDTDGPLITLATAHPAKFPDAVERACGLRPALPARLADILEREERYTVLPNEAGAVRKFISSTS